MMKKLIFSLLYTTGVTRLFAWWNRGHVPILCYHSITPRPELIPEDPWKFHLPQRYFKQHLEYLERRYKVVSLDEYMRARAEGRSLPPYSVVITFDDGCRNLLTVAAPLLREFSMPVTAFIATDMIREDVDESSHGWTPEDDEDYLSWRQVKELGQEYAVAFGSHTCSHPRLTSITLDEVSRELTDSYAEIRKRTGSAAPFLAYPHGVTSDDISELAKSAGYACAVTGQLGFNTHLTNAFELNRIVISSDDSLTIFAARIAGITVLVDRIRRWAGREASTGEKKFHQEHPLIQEAIISCKGRTTLQD